MSFSVITTSIKYPPFKRLTQIPQTTPFSKYSNKEYPKKKICVICEICVTKIIYQRDIKYISVKNYSSAAFSCSATSALMR